MKIVPEFRKREFLELIKDGIKDVSVSRPRKNLAWGVSVPGDESQVMYVWLDALSNYITVLGYPDNESWRDYWPADVQVVGKDILRFHAGIWPAMLMGLDLPLPKVLLVHGHVNVGGTKMSKSLGNGVEPNDVIKIMAPMPFVTTSADTCQLRTMVISPGKSLKQLTTASSVMTLAT